MQHRFEIKICLLWDMPKYSLVLVQQISIYSKSHAISSKLSLESISICNHIVYQLNIHTIVEGKCNFRWYFLIKFLLKSIYFSKFCLIIQFHRIYEYFPRKFLGINRENHILCYSIVYIIIFCLFVSNDFL